MIKIRKSKPEDAPELAKIRRGVIRSYAKDAYSPEVIKLWSGSTSVAHYRKIHPDWARYTALDGNKVVGYGNVSKEGHIGGVYVHKDYVGQGVGTKLILKLEDQASKWKVKKLDCVASKNAKPFYEKLGFKILKRSRHKLSDAISMVVYHMEKQLKNIIPVLSVNLPEYQADKEPDHEAVGKKVDDFIKQHFLGQHIAIRCIGSCEHQGKTVDDVIEIIKQTGTDHYDPERQGDRYENKEGKYIDFFAFDYHVEKDTKMFSIFTWPNYHLTWREPYHPIRIDIVILYDPAKLEQIYFTYKGRENEGQRSDGWVFKDQENKADAIVGIIKIT